jgi:hypothetical protein
MREKGKSMITDKFQFGHVYWATPVHKELPKRVVIVIGRENRSVQFAFVDDLRSADVDFLNCMGFGREFCKIRAKDHDYNCSCACELPAAQAAEIYAAINSRARR